MIGSRSTALVARPGARRGNGAPAGRVARAVRLGVVPAAGRRAFTLIELIVVMTVIVIILALAVPGLSAMNAEARMNAAVQRVNGLLTRAYYISVAEATMTAVRFMPSEWELNEEGRAGEAGCQRLAVYKYTARSDRQVGTGGGFQVAYEEYFEPVEGVSSVELPDDVWVAPLEALSRDAVRLWVGGSPYDPFGSEFVLDGWLYDQSRPNEHYFVLNADREKDAVGSKEFLNADDFLVVFGPQTGLRTGIPEVYQLRGYDPRPAALFQTGEGETAGERMKTTGEFFAGREFQRYNFTGLVFYRREPFVALGTEALGRDRPEYLFRAGRPYIVHRFGGGLLSGMQVYGQE